MALYARRILASLLCCVAACGPLSASAATLTWIGGNGNWNTTSLNWSGTTWSNLVPDDAVFAGTAGTVTLTENIRSGTITATTTGYTLASSSTFGLTVSRIDISSLGANGQLNVSAKLTGSNALSLAGAGDVTTGGGNNSNLGIRLTNTGNDFVGNVTITNRLVSYTADSVFGNAANSIILDGGGLLDNNVSVNLARNIEVRGGGGIIRLWNASNATWSGSLSGTGNISRTDMGTLNLSGNLAGYSGTFTQNGNPGIATNLTGSGTVGGNWTATVGTITFNSASNQTGTGSYSGSFAKSGAGVLTLTNATVGGDWTVNTGGGLTIQSNSAQTMAGVISGSGTVTKAGSGALTLTGASTNNSNWTIASGTMVVNSTRNTNNPTATSLGNMTTVGRTVTTSTGATLLFQAADAIGSYDYVTPVTLIADGGTITRVSGTTTFNAIGNVTLQNGGRLRTTNGSGSTVQSFGLNGNVTVSGTSGSFIDTLAGQTTNSGINLGNNTASYSGTTTFNVGFTGDPTADLTVSASLQNRTLGGASAILKTGAGRMSLSGANTFTGNMLISSGTVIANSTAGSNSATALGDMTTNGRTITTSTGATLYFNAADAIGGAAFASPVTLIANGGTITRVAGSYNSFGNLALQNGGRLTTNNGQNAAINSFQINGTLTVSGTSGSFIDSAGSSNNALHLGASGASVFDVGITGDPSADLTVSAPLANFGFNGSVFGGATSLTKTGSGSMRVTSASSYSGGTTLRAGTIIAANNSALGTAGTVTINDASTGSSNTSLLIDASGGSIDISRPITVANQGTGTATLGSSANAGSNFATFSGAITLATKDVRLYGIGTGDRTQFTGGISGTGNVTVTTVGGGAGGDRIVFRSAANSYLGTTTITAASTLQLGTGDGGATSFLPDDYAVTVQGFLKLAKGGGSETIAALLGSGTVEAIAGADTLIVGSAGSSGTFSGILRNNGATLAFTKSGTGTQVLTGANTYTGATTISGGRLQIGNSGTTGSILANVSAAAGTTLAFNRSDALTYSGTVSGAGTLAQLGSGTLTLSAANTYTGTTSLAAGVLALGNADAIGTTGTISFTGGTLQFTASNADDYSSRFSTAAGQAFSLDTNGRSVTLATGLTSAGATLAKLGSGTLSLTGSSTYSGNTTISAGVLRLGNGGSVAGNIVNNATLRVDRTDAFTLSNIVSGSGGLVQAGSGTTTLSGVNTYSGATTVSAGVLAVSTDLNLGTAPGSATPGSIVIDGGVLAFTSGFTLNSNRGIALGPTVGSGSGTIDVAASQTLAYGGVIASNGPGTDGLIKTGAGVLALTGAATYTGDTSVNAGTLQLGDGGSLASPLVAVASGATLSGRGTVNAVTVAGGGILFPGLTGSGTLTTGSLSFTGGATVTMGVTGTAPSTLLNVLGDVTPAGGAGSVVFAFGGALANVSTGTYTLLSYTGNLSDPSAFGYTGTTGARQGVTVSGTAVANAVSLVVFNAFPIWTGTNGTGWFASDNWELNTNLSPTSFLTNDTVEFNDLATSGTVVISGSNATPASTTFSGNTVAMTVEGTGGFGISTGSVIKSGSALVTITNANTFDGGTTLSAGRLRVGDDGALGTGAITVTAPAALSSDGATAHTLANGLHLDADVTLGDATDNGNLTFTGTVTFDGASRTITTPSNVTLSGLVTNGGLTKAGAGVLTITGSNNYANGTTLSAGTLRVGNDAALGAGGVALANGVTLSSNDTNARSLANLFTLNGDVTLGNAVDTGALTLGSVGGVNLGGATRQVTTASDVTFAGAVTNGGLTKAGPGTLTLAVASSYAAGTTLSAGAIALGNAGGLGSGALTVAGNGTVRTALTGTIANAVTVNPGVTGTFEATSGVATYAGVVGGSGSVAKSGGGTVLLSATSTYAGDTTISAGTLEVGGAGLLGNGSYAGAIANAGTLAVTTSANQTLSGAVSGIGALTKSGAGTLTLSNAANSFSGGATISGGVLAFANGALGTSGNVTVNGGTLRWATGNTQDLSSRLVLVNSTTATLDAGTNDVTLASGLGAGTSGAVTKTGAGTLTLTGSSGYTGLTTVSTGTLQIGGGGATGSVAGDIATAATVAFNRSDAVTYAGLISGAGNVRQNGSGTLTLSGNNTYSGQLTVAQGAVAVATVNNASANGPLGNSTNSVVLGSSGATGLLAYTGATASSTKRFTLATGGTGAISVPGATTLTLSGSIDGAGAFVKQGPGTLSLSGSSPFTGNMTITGGTVTVNLTVNTTSPTATSLGDMTTSSRTITTSTGATLQFTQPDAIGAFNYATPVMLVADGGTITRVAGSFNSIGAVELRNGGRLTTNNGQNSTVNSFSLNGNVTVSGTTGSFIDTVGTSNNGLHLATGVGSGSITFAVNSTGDPTADLTVSAPLINQVFGAAAAITKTGSGRMVLAATNTYTGNTTVNAGTLAIGPGGQIYNGGFRASVVTVASGATLDLQNWAYNETSTQSLGGLTAAATGVVVNGGTIRISGTAPTSYGRGVTVNSGGATLEAAAGANWTIDTVNDSSAWVYNGNPTIALAGGGAGTFQKVLDNGSGGLTKSGTGTWTLSGVNTFTGNTTISAGTLVLGGAGQLGSGNYGGSITNGGVFQITSSAAQTLSGAIANSGTITVNSSANQTLSGVVSGAGLITKGGAGTLTLTNASNSFTGGATIAAGVLSFANDALGSSGGVTMNGGTLRWESGNTQDISSRLVLTNATTATLDTNGNNVTLGTAIGGGSTASLVKTGAGTLALTGANDYTGGTTLSQGTLSFASGGLGSSGNVTLAASTVLEWAAGNTQDVSSRLVLPGSGGVTLDVGSNDVALGSGFGGGSGAGVTKAGAGTLTLSGSSGYTGPTTISTGTLALSGSGAIAAASGVDLPTLGATLDISGASGKRTIGGLSGAAGSAILLGGNTLTVGGDGSITTFAGVINGSGGFTLAANSVLGFTAQQSFTGPARVEAGTLEIAAADTLASASSIVVGPSATIDANSSGLDIVAGQTLAGYGTIRGNVNLLAGSILAPGGSVGTLTGTNGTATFAGGGTYVFDVANPAGAAGTGWDLFVADALDITASGGSPYVIRLTSLSSGTSTTPGPMSGWDPNSNYAWLFVGTANEITTFDPAAFSINRTDFDPYNAVNGNFDVVRGDSIGQSNTELYIVYAAVPEPGTIVLAGLGLVGLGLAAARRRKARSRGAA